MWCWRGYFDSLAATYQPLCFLYYRGHLCTHNGKLSLLAQRLEYQVTPELVRCGDTAQRPEQLLTILLYRNLLINRGRGDTTCLALHINSRMLITPL